MKIEYCQKCDKGIKPEEKAYTKNGQILCEECYLRTTKQAPRKPEPQLRNGKFQDGRNLTGKIDELVQKELDHENASESLKVDLLKKIANDLNKQEKREKDKKRKEAAVAVIGVVIVVLAIWAYRSFNKTVEIGAEKAYRVENVRVEKTYPNAWGVCGLVRNLKDHSVKGYVKIHFLDSSGKTYFTTSAYVKDPNHAGLLFYIQPDWIEPGEVGAFEYWNDPKAFRGLSDSELVLGNLSKGNWGQIPAKIKKQK